MTRCRLLWMVPEGFSLLALVFWGMFLGTVAQTGLLSGNGAWERLWAVTAGMAAVYLFLGWGTLCPGYFAGRKLSKFPPSAQEPGRRMVQLTLSTIKACLLWGWTGGFWLRAWGTGLEGWLWLLLGLVAAGILGKLLLSPLVWKKRGGSEQETIW